MASPSFHVASMTRNEPGVGRALTKLPPWIAAAPSHQLGMRNASGNRASFGSESRNVKLSSNG